MDYGGYAEWKRWDEKDFGVVGHGASFYFNQVFRKLLNKKNLKVLEIGFGNGEMLGYFLEKGQEVIGIEANNILVRRAKNAGYLAYGESAWNIPELESEKFDIIAAFSVIEHMSYDDLNALFSWARKHLSKRGQMYLRFPEGASPFGLAYQNGDFTHVTSLTKLKIQVLCDRNDLMCLSYQDDLLSSNRLCAFGLIGKICLLMLQWYVALLRWTMRILFYPLQPELRVGPNSIAVITIANS